MSCILSYFRNAHTVRNFIILIAEIYLDFLIVNYFNAPSLFKLLFKKTTP